MTDIINSLMAASTTKEVNDIVWDNLDFFNSRPFLWRFARNARRRISRIEKQKKESWKVYELN